MTEHDTPALVTVKPLEWHKSHMTPWADDWHTVPTGYSIRCADKNGWKWQGDGAFGYRPSADLAKADAQEHHAARILSAIDTAALADADTLRAEVARLTEALTPSGATKAAYIGEFAFDVAGQDEDGEDASYQADVPWATIKEIMAAILARAAVQAKGV